MITILNTTILTNDGEFSLKTISLEVARELVADGFQSAIGHQATADILSELLCADVKMNRCMYQQQKGEIAICFKLKGRPEEGKILSREEIEKIGYEFKVLEMHN